MNIVPCVKCVPDSQDIEIGADGSVSLEKAEWIIGEYDLQALEAAARLAESSSGKVMALSAGPQEIRTSKLRKDILSRGPDELYLVVDNRLSTNDTFTTAVVLTEAIRKLGQVDLVLFGEGSSDLYFQQVGLQVGEILGWPTLNSVGKIETSGSNLAVERDLEDEVEVLEVPLPAALCVTAYINQPRLPTMKDILKAGQKPLVEWSLEDLGLPEIESVVDIVSIKAPPRIGRKQIVIEANVDEAVVILINHLRNEGVI
jgi:electron transfer flavoprotein beta subunit